MFARYKRLVPRPQRELIAQQRLPKPNWFIGAAEQPLNPRDPALMQQIKEVKQRIRDRRNPKGQPGAWVDDRTITQLATRLEMSHDELAKVLGISRTTVSMAKARRIYELDSVVGALHRVLGPEFAGWLKQGRPCPLKLLEEREYERFERRADAVIFPAPREPRRRLNTAR